MRGFAKQSRYEHPGIASSKTPRNDTFGEVIPVVILIEYFAQFFEPERYNTYIMDDVWICQINQVTEKGCTNVTRWYFCKQGYTGSAVLRGGLVGSISSLPPRRAALPDIFHGNYQRDRGY